MIDDCSTYKITATVHKIIQFLILKQRRTQRLYKPVIIRFPLRRSAGVPDPQALLESRQL